MAGDRFEKQLVLRRMQTRHQRLRVLVQNARCIIEIRLARLDFILKTPRGCRPLLLGTLQGLQLLGQRQRLVIQPVDIPVKRSAKIGILALRIRKLGHGFLQIRTRLVHRSLGCRKRGAADPHHYRSENHGFEKGKEINAASRSPTVVAIRRVISPASSGRSSNFHPPSPGRPTKANVPSSFTA